jgi:hypothetical protein
MRFNSFKKCYFNHYFIENIINTGTFSSGNYHTVLIIFFFQFMIQIQNLEFRIRIHNTVYSNRRENL